MGDERLDAAFPVPREGAWPQDRKGEEYPLAPMLVPRLFRRSEEVEEDERIGDGRFSDGRKEK